MRLPWGLYRRPDRTLAVWYKVFSDQDCTLLSSHETRPEAVVSRLAQEEAGKPEAAADASQKELF